MTCNLDKFTKFEASEVVHDSTTGRYQVKLAHPPTSCPDGALNSSKVIVQKDSSVSTPTLSFSTKLNAPVVLMPSGVEVKEFVDPTLVPKDTSYGFWGWMGIILLAAVAIWGIRKLIKTYETDDSDILEKKLDNLERKVTQTYRGTETDRTAAATSPKVAATTTSPAAAPPAPPTQDVHHHHTTIVQQQQPSNAAMNILETSMLLGMMDEQRHHTSSSHDRETIIREREIIREVSRKEPEPKEKEKPTFSSDDNDTFSSDSSDSYSSDSGSSSYSSDSSSDSSYSSDSSSSSFGSDD